MFQENTFQAVLATDGNATFVFLIYGDIQLVRRASDITIGFNAGDQTHSYTLPELSSVSSLQNLESTSNVGRPGTYIFRVDENFFGGLLLLYAVALVVHTF